MHLLSAHALSTIKHLYNRLSPLTKSRNHSKLVFARDSNSSPYQDNAHLRAH
jgi:hypothetical protein